MHIGIAAPLTICDVKDLVGSRQADLPIGCPGAPLISTLIRSLVNRGHRVSAFTTDESLPSSSGIKFIDGANLSIHVIPKRRSAFKWRDGQRGRAWDLFQQERKLLVAAMHQSRPDVIHAHWTYEFAWAAADSGYPTLVTAHDSPIHVLQQSRSIYRALRLLMAWIAVSKSKHVTAVSPFIADALRPWAKRSVSVVPNPLVICNLSASKELPEASESPLVIGMVVNGWQRLKNPECSFRAFSLLRQLLPNVELHTFGTDFEPLGKAHKWCEENYLLDGCFFHGRLPFGVLQQSLAKCHLLLHTSRLEACPMGIAEAMSLGLPIVAGHKSGGVPWVVGDGGILVDIENPSAVASAMFRLLSNGDFYRDVSIAARKRTADLFDSKLVATQLEDLYRQIIRSDSNLSATPGR